MLIKSLLRFFINRNIELYSKNMDKQLALENSLKVLNIFIETIDNEYQSYDLERLWLTKKLFLIYMKLIELLKIFNEVVERQLIETSLVKFSNIIGKVVDTLIIKKDEHSSQLSKEETLVLLLEEKKEFGF